MTILIFIIILAVLIFIHELGHFLFAKLFNIRVDEFAIGFPPTLFKKKKGETTYKLNLIPFGGYVKIFGEDYESAGDEPRSFVRKKWWQQILVLFAGILFNIILAWVLISATYMGSAVKPVKQDAGVISEKQELIVLDVLPDSPADLAGLLPGDILLSLENERIQDVTTFKEITEAHEEAMTLEYQRGEEILSVEIASAPYEGTSRKITGIAMQAVAKQRDSVPQALWQGMRDTGILTVQIGKAFGTLIGDTFTGKAQLETLTGPVGLVGIVDDAKQGGFVAILMLTAIISLNLAVLNVIPFPALDGGRILFVIIETIIRRPINPKIALWMNGIGFLLLIGLMIAVTISDIIKIF